jgi:hypothetical protein
MAIEPASANNKKELRPTQPMRRSVADIVTNRTIYITLSFVNRPVSTHSAM